MQASESDLVCRFRRGEEPAFREVVDRHWGDLFGLAYSLMGNAADAEDVVQQSLLGAFSRAGSFEGRSSIKTWLVSILVNQASKARRSLRVRRALSLDGAADDQTAPPPVASTSRSPAAAVQHRADAATMLDALSPEHRQVIVLRELQGLTYDEIADALHIPRGTVESRLFRARRSLRRQFADYLEG